MPEISILPEPFTLGGVNIGMSVVVAWLALGLLILALLLLQKRIHHMEETPHGIQTVLELIVGGVYDFSYSRIGHAARQVAPLILTLMAYVTTTTIVEMFGLPPATEDINCTLALGLCVFIIVNIIAIHKLGIAGRFRSLARPIALMLPIRVLTDCVAPFSMAIRLFSNVLVGGVIMKLIYSVVPVFLPAALSSYFNLLHVGIQTFVFGLMPLIYVGEAIE